MININLYSSSLPLQTDIKVSVDLTAGEYVLLVTSDPGLIGFECDQDGESTAPYTLGLFEGLIPGSIILE